MKFWPAGNSRHGKAPVMPGQTADKPGEVGEGAVRSVLRLDDICRPYPWGILLLKISAGRNHVPAAGVTPPSEFEAASQLRLLRCRGFSLALSGSAEYFGNEMLQRPKTPR